MFLAELSQFLGPGSLRRALARHTTRLATGKIMHLGLTALLTGASLAVASRSIAAPDAQKVTDAMRRASQFMLDSVSLHGGFVRLYTEDLENRWGEVPARSSMVWVQDPGTVGVGRVLLEAYQATGDDRFLKYCQRTAGALVWGQLATGGWNYFIDFDPAGTRDWYETTAARCWGWEEFYHDYGNATFDDRVTTGATDFLLDLYTTTFDPKFRDPLLKALRFILQAQYPLGGWPQRFPIRSDRLSDHGPGYSAYYTFNDGVTTGNIFFLMKAYDKLGDEAYRAAAVRGMRFVAISQMGRPQAGWAQQYDMNLRPGAARSYEPAALAPSTTVSNIRHLMRFYRMTGDSRFLRGIPDALDWLDASTLPAGHSDEGHTHAQFIEVGTDRPLYAHREGTNVEDGRYWVDYEPVNFPGHYGMQVRIDTAALRREYDRVAALSPAEALAEHRRQGSSSSAPVSDETVERILESMDQRGAWIESLSVPDYTDWKFKPRRHFRGVSTETYLRNMRTLITWVRQRTGRKMKNDDNLTQQQQVRSVE